MEIREYAHVVRTSYFKNVFNSTDGVSDILKVYFIAQTKIPKNDQNILKLYFIALVAIEGLDWHTVSGNVATLHVNSLTPFREMLLSFRGGLHSDVS